MTHVLASQCKTVATAMLDPFVFGKEWLGLKDIQGTDSHWTEDQAKIIDAVVKHKRIAIVSGNGVGKSHLGAFLLLWYLFTREGSKVIATAATFSQISESLFPEARAMHASAKRPLGGKVLMMRIDPDPRNPNWFAVGLSTDDATSFQGRHSAHVLILIDEATGVEGPIFESAELMSYGPDDKIVAMANPLDAGSYFFGQCDLEGDKWHKLEISCENHPNFIQRKTVIPGAISYERVKELEKEYGRDHPLFKARVLGQWSKALGRFFPQFEKPAGRHVYDPATVQLDPWLTYWAGCDWGFRHDSSVLWGRFDGKKVYVVKEFVKSGLDSRELAQTIVATTRLLQEADGARRSNKAKLDAFYLSHECFNKIDGPRSRADEIGDELRRGGLPWPIRAKKERVDGLSLIRTMLNDDTLQISSACPRLIDGLKKALVNVDRPEDMEKVEGDDCVDSLRYLLASNPRVARTPVEIEVERVAGPLREKGDYLSAMIAQKRVEDKYRVGDGTFSLGRFIRRRAGSSAHARDRATIGLVDR